MYQRTEGNVLYFNVCVQYVKIYLSYFIVLYTVQSNNCAKIGYILFCAKTPFLNKGLQRNEETFCELFQYTNSIGFKNVTFSQY